MLQLTRSRQALAGLVPHQLPGDVIMVKNNADHNQGIAGMRWQAGETLELSPGDYARIADHNGFKGLLESGQFQILV